MCQVFKEKRSTIMTADELILKADKVFFQELPDSTGTAIELDTVKDMMIEFAKHHVKKALEAALEDVPYGGSDAIHYRDVVHILDSYPPENIK